MWCKFGVVNSRWNCFNTNKNFPNRTAIIIISFFLVYSFQIYPFSLKKKNKNRDGYDATWHVIFLIQRVRWVSTEGPQREECMTISPALEAHLLKGGPLCVLREGEGWDLIPSWHLPAEVTQALSPWSWASVTVTHGAFVTELSWGVNEETCPKFMAHGGTSVSFK